MVLRQMAIQADLMRWDDSRGYYVPTGTGRSRISARPRARRGGRLQTTRRPNRCITATESRLTPGARLKTAQRHDDHRIRSIARCRRRSAL